MASRARRSRGHRESRRLVDGGCWVIVSAERRSSGLGPDRSRNDSTHDHSAVDQRDTAVRDRIAPSSAADDRTNGDQQADGPAPAQRARSSSLHAHSQGGSWRYGFGDDQDRHGGDVRHRRRVRIRTIVGTRVGSQEGGLEWADHLEMEDRQPDDPGSLADPHRLLAWVSTGQRRYGLHGQIANVGE